MVRGRAIAAAPHCRCGRELVKTIAQFLGTGVRTLVDVAAVRAWLR